MVDNSEQHWYVDIIRWLFASIDKIVYWLLRGIYEVFFNVANANMLAGDTLRNFYGRVQLILGIIFMFKMAISLFNGILDPDSAKNEKTGVGAIIKRIIVVLVMLAMLVPLNIPGADIDDINDKNSQKTWNARLNENGILFGTLFELQSRILSQNTISRLILGTSGTKSKTNQKYEDSARELANIILKCFITINLQDEDGDITVDDDRVCSESSNDDVENAYDYYLNESNQSPTYLLDLVNVDCDDGKFLNVFTDENYYAFSYSYIFSTIVGVLCVIVIVSFTVDVAIRLFKLAILRLISPIPVLSYLNTKGSKTFENWVKTVITTYLDLFIRVAIINFIIFFIREFDQNGLGITTTTGAIGIFSKIFIYLGLLMFAREAPKFITDTLGIQSGGGLFGGLASLVGGLSSTITGVRASREAMRQDDQNPNDHSRLSWVRQAGSGLVTGITGAGDAYSGYNSAKEHNWRSALDRVNRANNVRLANASAGGTWWGSVRSQLGQDFTGDSEFDRLKRVESGLKADQEKLEHANKKLQSRADALGKMKKYGEEQAVKKNSKTTINGESVGYADWLAAFETAKARGTKNMTYSFEDASGRTVTRTMSLQEATRQFQEITEAAGREYLQHSDRYNSGTKDGGITNLENESGYTINTGLSADDFAKNFKLTKIDLINQVAVNTNGGTYQSLADPTATPVVVAKTDSISGIQESLYQNARDLSKADANRRGSDGRPGGRSA